MPNENLNTFIELLNGKDSVAFCGFVRSLPSDELNDLISKVTKSDGSDSDECRLSFIKMMMEDHFNAYKART